MAKKPKKASKPAKKSSAKKPAAKKSVKKASKPASKKPAKKVVKAKPKPIKKKSVVKKSVVKKSAKPASKKPKKSASKKKVASPNPFGSRAKNENNNRTRYSDRELLEFKNLIDEKLEAARNELKYLNDQINRKDDNGTDDTENKFSTMEDGTVAMEREYLTQMAMRQAQYIDHLEKALIRIQNKTYGICRVTGKLIDKDRLRAVPHATLSMEAKLIQHK